MAKVDPKCKISGPRGEAVAAREGQWWQPKKGDGGNPRRETTAAQEGRQQANKGGGGSPIRVAAVAQ